jgi:hypothetical protein
MTREETLEAIKVMQHYADGGEVEQLFFTKDGPLWTACDESVWDWLGNSYRIKKKATNKIKLCAYMVRGSLEWVQPGEFFDVEHSRGNPSIKRVPSEDKWVEVEE